MKYLIIKISDKEYALDVKNVAQVVRLRKVTVIPQSPDFVQGVISWQGKVLALVNLGKKFGEALTPLEETNRFVILKSLNHNFGIIVDSISQVLEIDCAQIEPPDAVFKEVVYLEGVARIAQRIILFLNVHELFSAEEVQGINQVQSKVKLRQRNF